MSKKTSYLILIIAMACVLFGGIVFINWWNRPLGQGLMLPSPTTASDSVDAQEDLDTETLEMVIPTQQSTPTPSSDDAGDEPPATTQTIEHPTLRALTPVARETATPEKPEPMYILAAGTDTMHPGYRGGLADVIRVVRVDFETPRVTVLTLPRDLWVELPGIKPEFDTLTHGKLNTAYTHGIPHLGRYEGEGGAPGLLAHTIAHNYGLVVDHYVVINMEVFVDIVDALDGIDISLNRTWDGRADTDNPEHDAWVFEEGDHHMMGEEALRFARIRLNYSEVTRTDNQTLVMCAVKEKMTRAKVFPSLPNLVKAFIGRVQTDLSPAQISQLISLMPKLGPENLLFVRFPNQMFVQGRTLDPFTNHTTFIWDIPIEDIRSFIQDFQQDSIPINIGGCGGRTCP